MGHPFSSTMGMVPSAVSDPAVKKDGQMLTGGGAELVTELLLGARPKLADVANFAFLEGQDETLSKTVKNLLKR